MTRAPFLTIDSDSHVGLHPQLWDHYLPPEYRGHPDRPRFVEEDGLIFFEVDRLAFPHQRGTRLPYYTPSAQGYGPRGGIDPDHRLADFMDPEGIDRGLLMPGRASFVAYLGNREIGNVTAHAWNSWLHDFCLSHPTRYFGFGVVNVADPAAAVAEMRRCVFELGMPAIFVNPQVVGATPADYHTLSDEHYFPIYEAAQELGVPLAIHAFSDPFIPGHQWNWPRKPGVGGDVLGFPFQGMQVLAHLVLGGVCERYPGVRFGIFEAGLGWVPMFLDRTHERMHKFADMVRLHAPLLRLAPEEYIQRQIWFGFEPEDPFVPDFLRWTRAPDRLLFSADYPHLDFEPGQLAAFLRRSDVPVEVARMALHDNPLAYFRWENTATPVASDAQREAQPA